MTPRLRMIAGPNGSGKSTLKEVLQPGLLENYINPDEIEKRIGVSGIFSAEDFGIESTGDEILEFFRNSVLINSSGLIQSLELFKSYGKHLVLPPSAMNSYFASVFSDFLRRRMIDQRRNLTFETVMSSPDKISLMADCRILGYRTYFIILPRRIR